ncbi:MAG: MerR family transcriptional regulator [Elusimicrobiota bacterium]|nr:MAG: MerR family transcriptional regulator [Elusimicrobiota bacterium]
MDLPFLPDKDYFSVREASRVAQVPPHTLRYWESRFGELRPSRKEGGHRKYSRADIELVLEIKELLQKKRMTVAGARRALIDRRRGKSAFDAPLTGPAPSDAASAKLLREVRKELKAIVEEMGR